MDDSLFIVIEDSNVEKVLNNVVITEEKIKDESELVLNKSQIVNELTNLLMNKHKQLRRVQQKVNMYLNMFEPKSPLDIVINTMKPIILCKKNVTLHGDKYDIYAEADQEYQDMYNLQSQKFDTYITQFKGLNHGKTGTYLQNTNALWNLQRPFVKANTSGIIKDNIAVSSPQDAYRHFMFKEYDVDDLENIRINKYETFRLIDALEIDTSKRPEVPDDKPGCLSGQKYLTKQNMQQIYDGDSVDVIGYFNIGSSAVENKIEYFDINNYYQQVFELELGGKVNVFFNDFVFNKSGNIVEITRGTVFKKDNTKVIINLGKTYNINGVKSSVVTIYKDKPSVCFVYGMKHDGFKYHKSLLTSTPIVFILLNSQTPNSDTLSIIKPNTLSELMYVNRQILPNINNVQDLRVFVNNVLKQDFDRLGTEYRLILEVALTYQNLSSSDTITNPVYNVPHYANVVEFLDFNKFNTSYNDTYSATRTFIDCALNRYAYLKAKLDYGYLHILNVLKYKFIEKHRLLKSQRKTIENKLLKMKARLDDVVVNVTKQEGKQNRVIAKVYDNIIDLENDNNKKIYFDNEFDKTRYDIINMVSIKASKEDITHRVIEQLAKTKEFDTKSKSEIEFEASCIVKGKRVVRDGDHAIMNMMDGSSFLYVRRHIEGGDIWIKVLQTPFKICTDSLPKFDELSKNDTITLDPFDVLCKKVKELKTDITYNALIHQITCLERTLQLIDEFDVLTNELNVSIRDYQQQLQLINGESGFELEGMRIPFHINLSNNEEDYTDYIGDSELLDLDKIFNNIEFSDKNGFDTFFKEKIKHEDININNADILFTFTHALDIELDDKVVHNILTNVNIKHPKSSVSSKLIEEETKIKQKINKDLYNKSQQYKAKADNLVKTKLKTFEVEILKSYYEDVIIYLAALLTLVLMIEYPEIIVNKILPKCVKYFSHVGYPSVSETKPQSLTKYIACIVSSLGTPGDVRFHQFLNKDVQELEKQIKDTIDEILEENAQLSHALEENKSTLHQVKTIQATDFSKYMVFNTTFKPSFEFNYSSKLTQQDEYVISYLKQINTIVKKSQHLKQNFYNNPNIFNSCCLEILSDQTNYHLMFESDSSYKSLQQNITQLPKNYLTTHSYIPPSSSTRLIDLFITKDIKMSGQTINYDNGHSEPNIVDKVQHYLKNNSLMSTDDVLKELPDNLGIGNDAADHEDIWWDDRFYPALSNLMDSVITQIKRYFDGLNTENIDAVNAIMFNKQSMSVMSVKRSIISFIRFQFPTILSRIINKKLDDQAKDDDSFEKIVQQIVSNKHYEQVLVRFKSMIGITLNYTSDLFFTSSNDSVSVKNISILIYIMVKVMHIMLSITINDTYKNNESHMSITSVQLTTIQKNMMSITSTIISHVFNALYQHISINDNDNEVIKKRVEKLRETHKQSLIAAYSADDEARRLQIMLKKMGLNVIDPETLNKEDKSVPNTTPEIGTTDISTHQNTLQENENYNISDYHGENVDDDEADDI